MKSFKCFLFVCVGLGISVILQASNVTLTQALAKKLVTMNAIANGGYQGKCITLQMHNNTHEELQVRIDQALIFRPSDSSYQNLVAIGDDVLAMTSGGQTTVTLQTFCGKSYASCPAIGLNYNLWKQGDKVMVEVAGFIKSHNLYNEVGQHAIWTLTNNHNLSGVYSLTNPQVSKDLTKLIAGLTGRKMPEYNTTYKPLTSIPGQSTYDPRVEKYYVEVLWTTPTPRNIHITIYKENGEVLRRQDSEAITMNEHKAIVELDPKKIPQGSYIVQLRDDDNYVYQTTHVEIAG